MARPTILVAESEPGQALSVLKLVLESAKYNVLTAHSTGEALDIFHMFPNVNVAVLVMDGVIDCELVARSIKQVTSKISIIATSARIAQKCENADHILCSHEPETLISLMRTLLGDPRSPVELPPVISPGPDRTRSNKDRSRSGAIRPNIARGLKRSLPELFRRV